MFSQAQLQYWAEIIAIDRILFSVDYPFLGNDGAVAFLQQAKLPEENKRKIAHQNTERLLRL